MLRGYPSLPLKRIALWGFWRATAWMWGAILGDAVIVLGVALGATLLAGANRLLPLDAAGWASLLSVGFAAAVGLEWAAQTLGLWGYSEFMPTVRVAGHMVGLSPIVQVTVLPALSVRLAPRVGTRQSAAPFKR